MELTWHNQYKKFLALNWNWFKSHSANHWNEKCMTIVNKQIVSIVIKFLSYLLYIHDFIMMTNFYCSWLSFIRPPCFSHHNFWPIAISHVLKCHESTKIIFVCQLKSDRNAILPKIPIFHTMPSLVSMRHRQWHKTQWKKVSFIYIKWN